MDFSRKQQDFRQRCTRFLGVKCPSGIVKIFCSSLNCEIDLLVLREEESRFSAQASFVKIENKRR